MPLPGDAHHLRCPAAFRTSLTAARSTCPEPPNHMSNTRHKSAPHYTSQCLYAITLCLLLAASSSCAQTLGGKDYFPLSDGARWEYVGQFHSSRGETYEAHAVSRVDGEILINGKRYFKYVTTADYAGAPPPLKHVEDVRYYRVADDGIYVRPGSDSTRPELLEMPLPVPSALRWLSGATEVRAERAGTLQVGGHEYRDCLKVTFRLADGVHTTTNYYAPGVGIVKTIYENTTEPKSTAELALEKYVP